MYDRDIDNTPLDEIEREIAMLENVPLGRRTVASSDRLQALRRASQRIRRSRSWLRW